MTRTYTAYEVADLLGMPYRTLMSWVEHGLLNPENARRGHRRATIWHATHVREASVLNALRMAGFSLQQLFAARDYLISLGHNPLSTGDFLVMRGARGNCKDIVKICDTGEAVSLLAQRGQLLLPLWREEEPIVSAESSE